MDISRRTLLAGSAIGLGLPRRARAEGQSIKIGVLTDLSGPYKDIAGPGSIASAKLAAEEFLGGGRDFTIEVISADHQDKPDIAVAIARQWCDRDGVDLLIDLVNSGTGLAVANVAKEKNKAYINTSAASSELTGTQCNACTIHWTYDTYMLARSTGGAMAAAGGDTWYFITADYTFGKTLQRETTAFVTEAKGKILGSTAYPFPTTTDFSSFLLQGQASGAKVIGLASAGADTINQIKQAHEFGLTQSGIKLAGLLVFITDVHAMGLEIAQGLVVTESYYWDQNDGTRAFADRYAGRMPGMRPSMAHAGVYAGTLHYLKAVADMGVAAAKMDGAATVAHMKAMPTDDICFGKGLIRVDGRKIHPSYLYEVKKPSESKGPWDYYKLLATTPADQAFRPLDKGGCPLVKA